MRLLIAISAAALLVLPTVARETLPLEKRHELRIARAQAKQRARVARIQLAWYGRLPIPSCQPTRRQQSEYAGQQYAPRGLEEAFYR
jgi:hypothetical protein